MRKKLLLFMGCSLILSGCIVQEDSIAVKNKDEADYYNEAMTSVFNYEYSGGEISTDNISASNIDVLKSTYESNHSKDSITRVDITDDLSEMLEYIDNNVTLMYAEYVMGGGDNFDTEKIENDYVPDDNYTAQRQKAAEVADRIEEIESTSSSDRRRYIQYIYETWLEYQGLSDEVKGVVYNIDFLAGALVSLGGSLESGIDYNYQMYLCDVMDILAEHGYNVIITGDSQSELDTWRAIVPEIPEYTGEIISNNTETAEDNTVIDASEASDLSENTDIIDETYAVDETVPDETDESIENSDNTEETELSETPESSEPVQEKEFDPAEYGGLTKDWLDTVSGTDGYNVILDNNKVYEKIAGMSDLLSFDNGKIIIDKNTAGEYGAIELAHGFSVYYNFSTPTYTPYTITDYIYWDSGQFKVQAKNETGRNVILTGYISDGTIYFDDITRVLEPVSSSNVQVTKAYESESPRASGNE